MIIKKNLDLVNYYLIPIIYFDDRLVTSKIKKYYMIKVIFVQIIGHLF